MVGILNKIESLSNITTGDRGKIKPCFNYMQKEKQIWFFLLSSVQVVQHNLKERTCPKPLLLHPWWGWLMSMTEVPGATPLSPLPVTEVVWNRTEDLGIGWKWPQLWPGCYSCLHSQVTAVEAPWVSKPRSGPLLSSQSCGEGQKFNYIVSGKFRIQEFRIQSNYSLFSSSILEAIVLSLPAWHICLLSY